jgi:hypothetical protein
MCGGLKSNMARGRTLVVQFATEEQYKQLKQDAAKHERTISDYIRWLIYKQRKEDEGK